MNCLLLSAAPFRQFISLHLTLSFASSSITPNLCMFSFGVYVNLLCSLTLCVLCPVYPLSLLCTCPNHLRIASLTWSPNCSTSAVLISNPAHPGPNIILTSSTLLPPAWAPDFLSVPTSTNHTSQQLPFHSCCCPVTNYPWHSSPLTSPGLHSLLHLPLVHCPLFWLIPGV